MKKATDTVKKPLIQSVERALDILELIASAQGETIRSSDIAAALKLPANTASNLVRTLYDRGYLCQDEARRYRLGCQCAALGSVADKWGRLREIALPVLKRTALETGDMAFLGVRDGHSLLCLEQAAGSGAITISPKQIWQDKLHCSASGKVLLAWMPESEREHILRRKKFEKYTEKTIVATSAIRREIAAIRKNGFATCINETHMDVAAIGTPIFDSDKNVVAALAQSFPTYFVDSGRIDLNARQQILKRHAATIGNLLK